MKKAVLMGGSSNEKYVFGSPEWLDFLHQQVIAFAEEHPDFRYSNCSVYTGAPTEIANIDDDRVAYTFDISGGEAALELREASENEVDVKITATWSEILTLACMHYDFSSPERLLYVQAISDRLHLEGHMQQITNRQRTHEEALLGAELHNLIAAGTKGPDEHPLRVTSFI